MAALHRIQPGESKSVEMSPPAQVESGGGRQIEKTPAAAAAAAAFDREVFRDVLLTRSINHNTSARAAVMPTNEALLASPIIMSPRPMTDR